jgi:phosphoenolpyruvate---glycerone phosphotransferase subunit DhaK
MTTTVSMRKFLNSPDQVVNESLSGLEAAHHDLVRYDSANQIVVRVDAPIAGKVGLVSGGGSGHEPLHGGFVGRGMLDAAAPGAVFTSPVPDQILAATKAVNGGAGVLHIVKNYTGDVLNFKAAAEEAADEKIEVVSVVTNDDVAVQDSLYTAGRRGVGVTVLLEKIAGAAAEQRMSLAEVANIARKVNAQGRSFGIALSSCTPPAKGEPIFDLPPGEMEVGIGIHGEPGRRRAPLASASEIAGIMVEAVISDLAPSRGTEVLAFVNGMGGTPQLELYLLYGEIERRLREAGLTVARNLVGSYITSLEMSGASLTVLALDEQLKSLWDAPVHTPALRWGV